MELIPILSLIILVATVATFVLAVGAYILFKIRERKGKVAEAPQPAAIPGEMVTPAQQVVYEQTPEREQRTTFVEERYYTGEQAPVQQNQPIYATGQQAQMGPEMRPTYAPTSGATTSERRYTQQTSTGVHGGQTEQSDSRRKFMRYTSDGYTSPEKQEKKKDEGLQWR